MLDAAVEHVRQRTLEVSLDQRTNGDALHDIGLWEFVLYDEFVGEDLLPDSKDHDRLHRRTSEDLREAILTSLEGFSLMDRAAFSLYAIDGYEYDEIGALQQRSAPEIEGAIAAAREKVRWTLQK